MIKVLFMGRKAVSAKCLQHLVDSSLFEVVGVLTDSHLSKSITADVARHNNIPLFTLESINEALENGDVSFDLGVSMLYWRKIKGALLTHPTYGVINFHPAPLPDFKGVGGYNLAILHALEKWSVTVHFIDEGIDTGAIIDNISFDIDQNLETVVSLERKSQDSLYTLFNKTMDRFAKNPNNIESAPNGGGLYISRINLEEMKRIDFSKDDVDRKVRAFWFPPYDGAFIEVNGQKFTLVNQVILDSLADPDASSLFTKPASRS